MRSDKGRHFSINHGPILVSSDIKRCIFVTNSENKFVKGEQKIYC